MVNSQISYDLGENTNDCSSQQIQFCQENRLDYYKLFFLLNIKRFQFNDLNIGNRNFIKNVCFSFKATDFYCTHFSHKRRKNLKYIRKMND